MSRYGRPDKRIHRILDGTALSRGVTRWSVAAILAMGSPLAYVVAAAGNMRTGGPAKTAAALARVAGAMTPEQRELYGQAFDIFAAKLNSMQSGGLDSASAAKRVIELAEQAPAPSRAPDRAPSPGRGHARRATRRR